MEYQSNLDVGDRTGKTALHHAAYNGHVQMLSLLLLKGASVKAKDRSDRTPLHYAAFLGIVQYVMCIYCTYIYTYTHMHKAIANVL